MIFEATARPDNVRQVHTAMLTRIPRFASILRFSIADICFHDGEAAMKNGGPLRKDDSTDKGMTRYFLAEYEQEHVLLLIYQSIHCLATLDQNPYTRCQ
jgi:hypothetical protein